MSGKTEVRVQSLRVSLTNQNRILLLKEIDGPLWTAFPPSVYRAV